MQASQPPAHPARVTPLCLGLVAAIPAVVAYNKISKDVDRYAARLDDFANEFSAIISRQLEGRD